MLIQLFKNKRLKGILPIILIIGLFSASEVAADTLEWDRFLIVPRITVEDQYSDNVFLQSQNAKKDNIVSILPSLSTYLAVTDSSRFGLHYSGMFSRYSKYDDLNERENEGSIDFSLTMPAGSRFEVGTKLLDAAVQADFEGDRDKPYQLGTTFAEANLKPGEFTEIGLRYDYNAREYDDDSKPIAQSDSKDDYTRHLFKIDYVNRYFPRFPFLLDYRYTINDRNNFEGSANRNSRSNAVFIGARWTPETRLSGNLRIGYQNTDYEGIQDVDRFVVDTALSYRLTEMTTLQFKVNRSLEDSSSVENESGNNYTFTTWEGNVRYRYSEPIQLLLRLRYQDKEYDETVVRKDDIYITRIGVDYSLNRWVDFSLSYQYSQKSSDDETEEYKENSGYFGVSLSI